MKTWVDAQNVGKWWAVNTIMKFRVPKGSCLTGRYLKDNDDMVAIRLAYNTTEDFVSNGTSRTEGKTRIRSKGAADTACRRLSMLCRQSPSPQHSATSGRISWIFKMLHHFVWAQKNKQILNWCSLLRNTPFSPTGKISVVKDRTKFKIFCAVLIWNEVYLPKSLSRYLDTIKVPSSSFLLKWGRAHYFCCRLLQSSRHRPHKNAPSSTDDMLILQQRISSEWITSSVGGTYLVVSNCTLTALLSFRK